MKKIFLTLLVSGSLLVSGAALAGPLDKATTNLTTAIGPTGLQGDFATTVGTVVKGILSVVGTVFLLFTVYAGVMWMTAQGNEDRVTKAKDTIQAAVIGLFIVMAAYAITAFVTSKVGGAAGGSSDTCASAAGGTCTSNCAAGQQNPNKYECSGSEFCCVAP
ncbi:MAG: pilin [Patescibacteria group bacterium]